MRYITETRNLFDISKVKETDKLKVIGNSIYSYQYPVNTNDPSTLGIFKSLKPNTNYTMSAFCPKYLGDATNFIRILLTNGDVIYLLYTPVSGYLQGTFSLTQEQIDNMSALLFYGRSESEGGPIIWSNIQIEEGDTATSYVPYGYLPMYKGKYKVSNVCQLLDKRKFLATQTINGVTFTNNGDGTITVNGTATDDAKYIIQYYTTFSPTLIGHTCLIVPNVSLPGGNTIILHTGNREITNNNPIRKTTGLYNIMITVFSGNTANNLVFKPQFFDLTEMYGAGHEPTSVEQFRQDFPEEMYDYSPHCWAPMKNIRYLDTTKNLFQWLGTPLYPDDYANAALIEILRNGIILQGNYSDISKPNQYNNGWFRPGAYYGTIANKVKLTAGDTVTISADYLLIDGPYSNTNIGVYLYGATNSTALVSVSKGKLKRVSATYPVTVTGEYFPVFTLNSSKVQITNIQIELGDTATPYVPYGYLPLN